MTSEDIRNVTFDKAMRGYRSEDVDSFLQLAAGAMDEMAAERAALEEERDNAIAAKASVENKMYILAQKVEEYRGQEETLKTALINAQRMGETVVHEAKQKADAMMRDATGKTELLRQQAEQEIANEKQTLEKLQAEVARFKATVLNFYKQHIESMSAIDAPMAHAAEVVREMNGEGREPAAEEEPAPPREVKSFGMERDEPNLPEEKREAPVEAKPAAPAGKGGLNLFEGVPLDDE